MRTRLGSVQKLAQFHSANEQDLEEGRVEVGLGLEVQGLRWAEAAVRGVPVRAVHRAVAHLYARKQGDGRTLKSALHASFEGPREGAASKGAFPRRRCCSGLEHSENLLE